MQQLNCETIKIEEVKREQMNITSQRNNWISARASTDERLLADRLMQIKGVKSHSALVRTLINDAAKDNNIN